MANLELDIAFWDYDPTGPLKDGTVLIEGAHPTFHTARIVAEIFEGMIRRNAYDVSELGTTCLMRTFENGLSPFVAIPVFPNRALRHGALHQQSKRHRTA